MIEALLDNCREQGGNHRPLDGEKYIRVVLRVYTVPGLGVEVQRATMDGFDGLMARIA